MRVLIIGCGYAGLPLAAALARGGHDVFGAGRSPGKEAELAGNGVTPLIADITDPASLERLPGPFDWVVNLVSSTRGGVQEYQEVYLQGTRHLIDWLAKAPPQKFVYTSSTSVYGQTDGSAVDEASPAEPQSETSRVLVQTEQLLLEAARRQELPAVVLRVAGIYGPGRGHLYQQYLKGEARMAGEGTRYLNMVHRDDLVAAIIAALERGQPGEIYNVADHEPVLERSFFEWLSHALDRPMPPAVSPDELGRRKRGRTNKRILNRKLTEELGVKFRYPTYREGYPGGVARHAG